MRTISVKTQKTIIKHLNNVVTELDSIPREMINELGDAEKNAMHSLYNKVNSVLQMCSYIPNTLGDLMDNEGGGL